MNTNTTITTLVSPTGRKIVIHHQDGTETTMKCQVIGEDIISTSMMEETTGEEYVAGKEAIGWTVTRRTRALVSY